MNFVMPDQIATPQDLSALIFEIRDYAPHMGHGLFNRGRTIQMGHISSTANRV